MFDKIGKSKFMKFVLFITTFAFVGTGIVAIILYKIFGGISGAVAINGKEITFAEINFRANQIRAGLEAQGLTRNTKRFETDILRMAVQQAINDELLYQEAEKESITATDEEVKRYILDMELFKKDGKFSKEKYVQFLKSFSISPQVFEDIIKKKLSIIHLYSILYLGGYITDEEIQALSFLRNASISGKILVVNAPSVDISEKELKEFYEKNKDKFKIKEGEKLVIYRIDIDKIGKDNATKKAKEIYKNLKENKPIEDSSVEKFFEGIYKNDINLPETIKKELEKIEKDKNILFVKTDKDIYIGKYLGAGYSYKSFDEVKDSLKEVVSLKKKEKLTDEIYKKLIKVYKNKGLEELANGYNGNISSFENRSITDLALNYSINPIQLEKTLAKGKHILKLKDKVIILEVDSFKFSSDKTGQLVQIKPIMEGMRQETVLKMYLDKLKKNSEIEINPVLKEKLKL